jgi:hypothetical protein
MVEAFFEQIVDGSRFAEVLPGKFGAIAEEARVVPARAI